MIMENPDSIEQKFRSSFSDFGQEPPARIWENLNYDLNPKPKSENLWMRISGSNIFPERQMRRYIVFAGAAFILFLAIVYFASKDNHTIRGHAYAGDVRLYRGVAVLFRVGDKVMPWDSVNHYQSTMIDIDGYYQFSHVEPGTYLLRIAPEEISETSKKFLPSWFDQHENPDSSHVIIISSDDIKADVHLISKSLEAK
jgi:hypothetical protein